MLEVFQGEDQDLISMYKNYPLKKFPKEKMTNWGTWAPGVIGWHPAEWYHPARLAPCHSPPALPLLPPDSCAYRKSGSNLFWGGRKA
jgi:hypothetical protein